MWKKAYDKLQEANHRSEREREEAQQQILIAERRKEEAERQTQVNKRRAEESEAEARELGTQWVVRRNEIQLTNVELGRGGWGKVMVANFRGIQVAAKCLYEDLASDLSGNV